LQNVLLEVRDGVLHLTCTDLEVGAHIVVAGKAEREGSCAVPARQLLEYVQQLPPASPVRLEQKKGGLIVSTQGFNAKFPTVSVDDFPLLPVPQKKRKVALDGRLFCQGLSNTLFAAARDETRPEIHSVFVSSKGGELGVAATDSFRLSEQLMKIEGGVDFSFMLPVSATQEVIRLFGGVEELGLLIEQNYVAFQADSCDLSTRLIDGNYPNYRQIIPKKFSTNGVVDCEELLRALKVLAVFIPKESRRVVMKIKPDKDLIRLEVEGGETGSGQVDVVIEGKGKEVDVLFNIQYLLEGFQHIASKKCELSLGGESDPLVLRPHDSTVQQLYVVMPIQS